MFFAGLEAFFCGGETPNIHKNFLFPEVNPMNKGEQVYLEIASLILAR